jgi:hypothetical protein
MSKILAWCVAQLQSNGLMAELDVKDGIDPSPLELLLWRRRKLQTRGKQANRLALAAAVSRIANFERNRLTSLAPRFRASDEDAPVVAVPASFLGATATA